jgi:hypothetical protein
LVLMGISSGSVGALEQEARRYIRPGRVLGRAGESYISPSVQRDAIQRWVEYKDIEVADWL